MAPRNGPPSTPTEIIPTPAIALIVIAPPLGNCSVTTPRVVGQKNVFPTPYIVPAAKIASGAAPALAIQKSPVAAMAAQAASNPSGDMRWAIGPAKKRSTAMIADV